MTLDSAGRVTSTSVLFANDQLIGQYQSVYRMTYSGNPWTKGARLDFFCLRAVIARLRGEIRRISP